MSMFDYMLTEGEQAEEYKAKKAKEAEDEKRKENEYIVKQMKRVDANERGYSLDNNPAYRHSVAGEYDYRKHHPNEKLVKKYNKEEDKRDDALDYAGNNADKYIDKHGLNNFRDEGRFKDLSNKQKREYLDTIDSSYRHYMKTHKNESYGIFESVRFLDEV